MPRIAATIDSTSQMTLESDKFLPLSKMYCIPWRELAWEYSITVLVTVSFKT